MALIEETVTAVSRDGEYVWLETSSGSVCGSCGSGGSCGASVIGRLVSPKPTRMRLLNHLDLQPGEQALVGMEGGALLRAALVAYLLPLGLLLGFSVVTSLIGFSDGEVLLAALIGLGVGFQLIDRFSRQRPEGLAGAVLLERVVTGAVPIWDLRKPGGTQHE